MGSPTLLAANAIFAGRCYEEGNCMGITFPNSPLPEYLPTQVNHNTFNCR